MYRYTAIVNVKYDDNGKRVTPSQFVCAGIDTRININMVCCSAVAECETDTQFVDWVSELKEFTQDVMRPACVDPKAETPLETRAKLWWIP
jgi:hypothetical protein